MSIGHGLKSDKSKLIMSNPATVGNIPSNYQTSRLGGVSKISLEIAGSQSVKNVREIIGEQSDVLSPQIRKEWGDVDTARKESERNIPTKTSPQRGTSPYPNEEQIMLQDGNLEEKSNIIEDVIQYQNTNQKQHDQLILEAEQHLIDVARENSPESIQNFQEHLSPKNMID